MMVVFSLIYKHLAKCSFFFWLKIEILRYQISVAARDLKSAKTCISLYYPS